MLHVLVFVAALIDATGLPIPGRLLLVAAGASAGDPRTTVTLVAAGALGALAGDHLWYAVGRMGGPRLLRAYCRLSLGSGRCLSGTLRYFERFGPLTIVIGRFVAGVRIFAAPMAGAGAIPYPRYLAFDGLGALLWAGTFVGLGYVLGDHWRAVVERLGVGPVIMAIIGLLLLGTAATVAVRLRRRRRHGPARLLR